MNCNEMTELYKAAYIVREGNNYNAADKIYKLFVDTVKNDLKRGTPVSSFEVTLTAVLDMIECDAATIDRIAVLNYLRELCYGEGYRFTVYSDNDYFEIDGWVKDQEEE